MDSLLLCVAFGPLAVYLLLLGVINLRRRPLIVSGGRDTAALAVALSGFVLAGPFALLVPMAAVSRLGGFAIGTWQISWTWVLLIGLYVLIVTLIVLAGRPRMVVYNITVERLRPILAEIVPQLDAQARWAGETLLLPQLGVHLHIEAFSMMRNVSLVAIKPDQPLEAWQRLEQRLAAELSGVRVARNPRGASLVATAAVIALAIVYGMIRSHDELAQALREMLQL